jgi:hypothetical protein
MTDHLANVVQYLHASGIDFRLMSYPSPEPAPPVAFRVRPAGAIVDVHLVLADGRLGLGCVPTGGSVNLLRLRAEIGATVLDEARIVDLPWPYNRATGWIPPLGGLFGAPVFVDDALAAVPLIAFHAFSATDFIEVMYDDFARLEQPRVVALAGGEQLPPPSIH